MNGMRDVIAAKVLHGLCINPGGPFQPNPVSGWGLVNCKPEDVARLAYEMADAMMVVREEREEDL